MSFLSIAWSLGVLFSEEALAGGAANLSEDTAFTAAPAAMGAAAFLMAEVAELATVFNVLVFDAPGVIVDEPGAFRIGDAVEAVEVAGFLTGEAAEAVEGLLGDAFTPTEDTREVACLVVADEVVVVVRFAGDAVVAEALGVGVDPEMDERTLTGVEALTGLVVVVEAGFLTGEETTVFFGAFVEEGVAGLPAIDLRTAVAVLVAVVATALPLTADLRGEVLVADDFEPTLSGASIFAAVSATWAATSALDSVTESFGWSIFSAVSET